MKALVWQGKQNYTFEDIPVPSPGTNQVLVRIEAAAVCGSDFHLSDFGAQPPFIPGHEAAGIVDAAGEEVSTLKEGDRVALNPVQVCGSCYCCRRGMEHLCLNCRHLGSQGVDGTWAEYVVIDAANAYPVPPGVSLPAAGLSEPSAVCYESFQRARLKAGDYVLIIGDGPFGFLHAQIAQAMEAGKIFVAGHYGKRLARIQEKSGAIICNTRREDVAEIVHREIDAPGVDIVIEATGSGHASLIGLQVLRPRGTLVVFSYIREPEILDPGLIHMKELNILGSCRSLKGYEPCLKLIAEGTLDTEALIDLRVPLEDYQGAFDALTRNKEDIFKAVLLP